MTTDKNDITQHNEQTNNPIRITSVELQRINITRPQYVAAEYRYAEPLPLPTVEEKKTVGTVVAKTWHKIKLAAKVLPYLVSFIAGLTVKNWKTTLGAIVGGIATVLNVLGIVEISADIQMALVTIGLFIVGLFAGDAKKNEQGN